MGDELLDSLYELSPNDNLLNLIGYDIKNNSRKSKLPIPYGFDEQGEECKN